MWTKNRRATIGYLQYTRYREILRSSFKDSAASMTCSGRGHGEKRTKDAMTFLGSDLDGV
jgi:hypothetical protein